VERQIVIIWAGGNKYLDDLEIGQVRRFEKELYQYIEMNNPGIFKGIREKKTLDDAIKAELKTALEAFKEAFQGEVAAAVAK
jgi:F-type H+-transporting ATPase subunit alpha